MKASELVNILVRLVAEHGDLPVLADDGAVGGSELANVAAVKVMVSGVFVIDAPGEPSAWELAAAARHRGA